MISILSFAIACLIRNNYFIFIIAITLIQVFNFLENVNWRKLIVTFLIVISIPASSFLLKSYYQSVTHVPISQGLPMLAYVTMGTQDSPVAPSIGGWWDGYNTWLLKNNDFDRPKAVEQAKNDLKKNMQTFYNQPMYAVEFFYKKILSTWLEPTFQSIWTGPLPDLGNVQNSRILKSIYEEKNGYNFLNSFGKVLTVSIYLLTLISVVYNIKNKNFSAFELFTIIFFLGGFFFHIFWETKSQYVYIYVLLLIPSAAKGLEKLESIPILKRIADESHNQISKVHCLIMDVITSQSTKLIRLITSLGIIASLFSFLMIIWIFWSNFVGTDVAGWVSTYAIVSLFGGVQLISLGVIGDYIGRIYLENKCGSRNITSDCIYDESDE